MTTADVVVPCSEEFADRARGVVAGTAPAAGAAAVGRTGSPPTRLIFQSLSSVAFSIVTGIGPSRTASVVTAGAAAAADQVELETEAASVVVASSSSSERVVGS